MEEGNERLIYELTSLHSMFFCPSCIASPNDLTVLQQHPASDTPEQPSLRVAVQRHFSVKGYMVASLASNKSSTILVILSVACWYVPDLSWLVWSPDRQWPENSASWIRIPMVTLNSMESGSHLSVHPFMLPVHGQVQVTTGRCVLEMLRRWDRSGCCGVCEAMAKQNWSDCDGKRVHYPK